VGSPPPEPAGEGLSEKSPSGLSLEEGIAQIAQEIEAGLPEGRRIAVVNFESPSAYFSNFVLEELQGHFVNNKRLVVTERSKLELLRNELDFQMSGDVSDESVVSIGKWLGAQVIITGSFTDMGGTYRCRFNAIDIETAVRQVSPAVTVRRDNTVAFMLPVEAAPSAQVPARPDPLLAAAYFNAGFAHYEAKRYALAVADFSLALGIKQDDEASLRYRAYSYIELKDYDLSITDMNRLIQMKPENAGWYLTRGYAYDKKKDYDKAIADYNQAIRLDPNFDDAYLNRGAAWFIRRDFDKAIADYNQAIRINPYDGDVYYNRGHAYYDKGDFDRAMADYNQAIRLNPNDYKAYNSRGIAYDDTKGDFDRAIADYNQAIRLNPNDAGVYYFNRGIAYSRKGDPDRAMSDYNQAIRLNFINGDVYYNRGLAYAEKGDLVRARADWEKALRIDPNNAGARNNLERLRRMGY
jgi:tetratricopeptide (TPR) repeat protein